MEKQNTKSLSTYEKILNTAEDLFYQEGIQSVGIDKIIKEAGVAMNTLYKYFPSKDILIEQYLKNRDIKWRAWFNSYIKDNISLKENILSLFDALDTWFNQSSFRGCAFINGSGELGETKPYIYEISKFHKESIYNDIYKLFKKSNIQNADKLSKQILILIEGAIVTAYINNDKKSAVYAKDTARLILENI